MVPGPPDEHVEEEEELDEIQGGISAQDADFLRLGQQGLKGIILEHGWRHESRRHQENSKNIVKHGRSLPIHLIGYRYVQAG